MSCGGSEQFCEVNDPGEEAAVLNLISNVVGVNKDRYGRAMPRNLETSDLFSYLLFDLAADSGAPGSH